MLVSEHMLFGLRIAEQYLDSQMSLNPKPPPLPLWKVLEIVRDAIKCGEGLSLNDLDDELAAFP